MYSLSKSLRFSLDTPWEKLTETVRRSILEGLDGKKVLDVHAAGAKVKREAAKARRSASAGSRGGIERHYRATQRGEASLRHGGVARQGDGGAHLPRLQRRPRPRDQAAVHYRRQDPPRHGPAPFRRVVCVSRGVKPSGRGADADGTCWGEIRARVKLLLGIGLDYLNFNRAASTLRRRVAAHPLSTQIAQG